jgi:hypothetical protein
MAPGSPADLPPTGVIVSLRIVMSIDTEAVLGAGRRPILGSPCWNDRILGSSGVYVAFLAQMAVRTLLLIAAAARRWPIRVAWEGVGGGILLTATGLLLAGA